MKIVIDIDKKDFDMCFSREISLTASIAESCIANGTVLPKGHGDLIDKDHFEKLLRDYGLDYEADTFIPMATTVIKADK